MSELQFPTASGTEAGRWCPTGTGDGTHVATGAAAAPAAPAGGASPTFGSGSCTLRLYITACNIKKLDLKFYGITKPKCWVVIKFDGKEIYTSAHLPGLDPEWEEEMFIKFDDPETSAVQATFYCNDQQLGDEQNYGLSKLVKMTNTYKGLIVPGGKADMMFQAMDFGAEAAEETDDSFMDFL